MPVYTVREVDCAEATGKKNVLNPIIIIIIIIIIIPDEATKHVIVEE